MHGTKLMTNFYFVKQKFPIDSFAGITRVLRNIDFWNVRNKKEGRKKERREKKMKWPFFK